MLLFLRPLGNVYYPYKYWGSCSCSMWWVFKSSMNFFLVLSSYPSALYKQHGEGNWIWAPRENEFHMMSSGLCPGWLWDINNFRNNWDSAGMTVTVQFPQHSSQNEMLCCVRQIKIQVSPQNVSVDIWLLPHMPLLIFLMLLDSLADIGFKSLDHTQNRHILRKKDYCLEITWN